MIEELRKTSVSFVMSVWRSIFSLFVRPSAWNKAASTRRICIKFVLSVVEKSAEKIKVYLQYDKNYGICLAEVVENIKTQFYIQQFLPKVIPFQR